MQLWLRQGLCAQATQLWLGLSLALCAKATQLLLARGLMRLLSTYWHCGSYSIRILCC